MGWEIKNDMRVQAKHAQREYKFMKIFTQWNLLSRKVLTQGRIILFQEFLFSIASDDSYGCFVHILANS